MQQGTPQFTPLQMLEAGRQAEAQGKIDFAVQFYLHLVEFYGQTPEAAEARTALTRMANAGRPQPPPQQQVWQAGSTARQVRYRSGRFLAAMLSALGWLIILGAVIAGAAAFGAYVLQVTFLQSLEVDPQRVVRRLPLIGLAGVVLVICGQMARAVFEQANSTRELLSMQKGRSGGEQP